jgi:hypothetical protein
MSWINRILSGPSSHSNSETASMQIAKGSSSPVPDEKPGDPLKALDFDPDALTHFYSGEKPNGGHPGARGLPYSTLLSASELSTITPFVRRRVSQTVEFSKPQPHPHALGYAIDLRDENARKRTKTKGAQKMIEHIEQVFNRREPFRRTLGKMAHDSFVYDQACAEIRYTVGHKPHSFRAVDASTIWRARPKLDPKTGRRTGPTGFIQMIGDQIRNKWSEDEILFGVRRERSGIYFNGYGFPEIQEAYDVIVDILRARSYNSMFFINGMSAAKMLVFKTAMDRRLFGAFQAQMRAQLRGVDNVFRTAMLILNPDGGPESLKESVEALDLGYSNKDMEFSQFFMFLMQLNAAIWGIDLAELGMDKLGGVGAPGLNDSNPKDTILLSREFGMRPNMAAMEGWFNENIVWRIDEDFGWYARGLDDVSETQRINLTTQAVNGGYKNTNEARRDLKSTVYDRDYFKEIKRKHKIDVPTELQDAIILTSELPMNAQWNQMFNSVNTILNPPPEQDPNAGGEMGEMGGDGEDPNADNNYGYDDEDVDPGMYSDEGDNDRSGAY